MVVFNYSGAEINAKVVYYGPALSGKTTNLEYIYEQMPSSAKGKMVSMKTRTDRTLFFDFLPLELGEINGYKTRMLLYTVPGQVYYNATRKLVLKGADAVVFVADSSPEKMQENIDSLRNLEENLNEHGLTLDTIPWVMQYNKRDLPDALPIKELNDALNVLNVPAYESVASTGEGIYESFQGIAALLYNQLVERLEKSGEAPAAAQGTEDVSGIEAQAPMPAVVPPVSMDTADRPVIGIPEDEVPLDDLPQVQIKGDAEPAAAKSGDEVSSAVDDALREIDGALDGLQPADESLAANPAAAFGEANPVVHESDNASLHVGSKNEMARDADESNSAGRVIDFEDVTLKPDEAREEGDTFITNPFRSEAEDRDGEDPEMPTDAAPEAKTKVATAPFPKPPAAPKPAVVPKPPAAPKPAVAPKPPAAPKPAVAPKPPAAPKPAPASKLSPEPKPAPAPKSPIATDDVRVVKVPVVLTRSQMKKSIPLRLELEIKMIDDEA